MTDTERIAFLENLLVELLSRLSEAGDDSVRYTAEDLRKRLDMHQNLVALGDVE